MRIFRSCRSFLIVVAVVGAAATSAVPAAGAEPMTSPAPAVESAPTSPTEAMMRAVREAPTVSFRLAGGTRMRVASRLYDRAQVAPLVGDISSLPHGSELAKLQLYAANEEEVTALCGEATMACYDPVSERMVVSGQEEEIDGISRESVIAHEYGHHIANNRAGGIWPAFDAGTLRWSTYEQVCERTREGLAFPGNEGAHYWENPGEAFAQSYSQLVDPQSGWNYSPLFAPNQTSLRKLREDVLDPVEPSHSTWRFDEPVGPVGRIADAIPLGRVSMSRELKVPYDGRIRVHLRGDGGGYRLTLIDPETGQVVAEENPESDGITRLRYADCGQRRLELTSTPVGLIDSPFVAHVVVP
jgi:hypothetical protein